MKENKYAFLYTSEVSVFEPELVFVLQTVNFHGPLMSSAVSGQSHSFLFSVQKQ